MGTFTPDIAGRARASSPGGSMEDKVTFDKIMITGGVIPAIPFIVDFNSPLLYLVNSNEGGLDERAHRKSGISHRRH